MQAGQGVSHDRYLGPGWKHMTAIRRSDRLELFVDGKPSAESNARGGSPFDLAHSQPLLIGFGGAGYFSGRIQEVRVHRRALAPEVVKGLAESERRG